MLRLAISLMLQGPGDGHVERLTAEGRYAEAAAEVERSGADALQAGILRAQAGDVAHAWAHFERYLAQPGLSAAARATGEQRRDDLRSSTRVITMRVEGPAQATVVAIRLDERLPPLATKVVDGSAVVRIDRHDWELRIVTPGYSPVQRRVGRDDAVQELKFMLTRTEPERAAPVQPVKAKRGGELAAGLVVLPVGVVALGGVIAMLPGYLRTRDAFEAVQADLAGRAATADDLADLRALRDTAQHKEAVMAGFGATAAIGVLAGTILLAHGRRLQKKRQLQLEARPGVVILGLSGQF